MTEEKKVGKRCGVSEAGVLSESMTIRCSVIESDVSKDKKKVSFGVGRLALLFVRNGSSDLCCNGLQCLAPRSDEDIGKGGLLDC